MIDCVPILLVLVLTEKYDTMQDSYGVSSVSKTATGKIIYFFSKHGVRCCASLVNVYIYIYINTSESNSTLSAPGVLS